MSKDEFCIKYHNKTFYNETIVLNNTGFINCKFKDCTLHMDNNPEDLVWMLSCDFDKDCDLRGDGWNYDFVAVWQENMSKGLKFSWEGPIGNEKVTKH